MIYDQCISCFLRHPEIWINLANFELESSGPSEARAIFREAIEHIPKIVMLRLAFAEFEEKLGNNDAVYDILMKAFHQIPCGFTFSVLQRFIRRREGVSAARKLFSETYLLRQDKALAFEVSILSHTSEDPLFLIVCFVISALCIFVLMHLAYLS